MSQCPPKPYAIETQERAESFPSRIASALEQGMGLAVVQAAPRSGLTWSANKAMEGKCEELNVHELSRSATGAHEWLGAILSALNKAAADKTGLLISRADAASPEIFAVIFVSAFEAAGLGAQVVIAGENDMSQLLDQPTVKARFLGGVVESGYSPLVPGGRGMGARQIASSDEMSQRLASRRGAPSSQEAPKPKAI